MLAFPGAFAMEERLDRADGHEVAVAQIAHRGAHEWDAHRRRQPPSSHSWPLSAAPIWSVPGKLRAERARSKPRLWQ